MNGTVSARSGFMCVLNDAGSLLVLTVCMSHGVAIPSGCQMCHIIAIICRIRLDKAGGAIFVMAYV